MLEVKMTPNLLGFRITGDYHALNDLYDAIWALAGDNDDRWSHDRSTAAMCERLLALCYDLRHAYQGDRDVDLVESGLHEWHAEAGVPETPGNAVFSVSVLYPEAMYELLALGCLVQARCAEMATGPWARRPFADVAVWDRHVCMARYYQSLVLAAVEAEATKGRFSRIREAVADPSPGIALMYRQWLDVLNADHAGRSRKGRAENLAVAVRDLGGYYRCEQYLDLVERIDTYAAKKGVDACHVGTRESSYDWMDGVEW